MSISKIKWGYTDGDKEIKELDFDNFYYDAFDLFNKVKNQEDLSIICARKGAGKTIFAHYFKKKHQMNSTKNYCEVISFSSPDYSHLIDFRVNESDKPYKRIWQNILLVIIASELQKAGISHFDDIEKNFSDLISKYLNEVELNFKFFKATFKNPKSGDDSEIFEYSKIIEKLIDFQIRSGKSISLLFDNLDENFKNTDDHKKIFIDFLFVINELNDLFSKKNSKIRLIALVRSDIMSLLSSNNFRKIKQNNSIEINWVDRTDTIDQPLIKMILSRVRKSSPELALKYTDDDKGLFYSIFPKDVEKHGRIIPTLKLILERTMLRPRDLITFLNLYTNRFKTDKVFNGYNLIKTCQDYSSSYFLGEVKDELYVHVEGKYNIESIFHLLRELRAPRFDYNMILDINRKRKYFEENQIGDILNILFELSIIGNKVTNNEFNSRHSYIFKYRNYESKLMIDQEMLIHHGLREALFNNR